jgi:hypothetical protein
MQGPLVHTWSHLYRRPKSHVFIAGDPSVSVTPPAARRQTACGQIKLAVRLMGISRRECSMQGPLVHTCTDGLKATCLLQEIPQYPSLHLQQEGRQLVVKLSWQSV